MQTLIKLARIIAVAIGAISVTMLVYLGAKLSAISMLHIYGPSGFSSFATGFFVLGCGGVAAGIMTFGYPIYDVMAGRRKASQICRQIINGYA